MKSLKKAKFIYWTSIFVKYLFLPLNFLVASISSIILLYFVFSYGLFSDENATIVLVSFFSISSFIIWAFITLILEEHFQQAKNELGITKIDCLLARIKQKKKIVKQKSVNLIKLKINRPPLKQIIGFLSFIWSMFRLLFLLAMIFTLCSFPFLPLIFSLLNISPLYLLAILFSILVFPPLFIGALIR
ncbi:hypothetical protein MYE_00250 [Mycoplasma yeatsii GM274B]|nr:hypothetical protein MYE_00250 [Mycoplasma yeatsii GM274B]